jgi:hypothetical protein
MVNNTSPAIAMPSSYSSISFIFSRFVLSVKYREKFAFYRKRDLIHRLQAGKSFVYSPDVLAREESPITLSRQFME